MGLKENIKKYRLGKEMTLDDVANKLGVSKPTIQRYESGVIVNIPPDKIEKLAEIFNTTPSELMGWEDSEDSNYENKLGHYEIDNFIQRNNDTLYSNLLEVLKEHIPDYHMYNGLDHKQYFEENIQNAVDFILQELTLQLLDKIVHSKESKIFHHIKSTVSTYNEKSIKESMLNSKEVLFKESEEIIKDVLLEYATTKFIEEIKKNTGVEFYGPAIYPDIAKVNSDLIKTITFNIQNILFQELYGNILLLLIQDYYLNLNEEGKAKILDYISDLSDNQKYIKDNNSNK